MFWVIANFILSSCASFIVYNLTLSFCGVFLNFKKTLLPVLIFSTLIFTSKFLFHSTAPVHTILIVIICTVFVRIFNPVNLTLSLISVLLTLILLVFASTAIIFPLLENIGLNLALDMQSLDWVVLNLGELLTPSILLLIFRAKKRTIISYLDMIIK